MTGLVNLREQLQEAQDTRKRLARESFEVNQKIAGLKHLINDLEIKNFIEKYNLPIRDKYVSSSQEMQDFAYAKYPQAINRRWGRVKEFTFKG